MGPKSVDVPIEMRSSTEGVILYSHPDPYVRYRTVFEIIMTENGSSQGTNTFTYERYPLGPLMI